MGRTNRALIGAVLGLGLLALPTAANAASPMAELAGSPELAGPAYLRDLADTLTAELDNTADGGVWVDPATGSVTVMVVRGKGEQAVAARRTAHASNGIPVHTTLVARDLATLESLRDTTIWQQMPADLRSHITATQIDTPHNQVVLEVDNPSPAVRREVWSVFGSAVSVRQGTPAVVASRFDDQFLPHDLGARVIFTVPGAGIGTGEACTTGYPATYQSKQVIVTAGHCAPFGSVTTPTAVTNGALSGEPTGNGNQRCVPPLVSPCLTQSVGAYGNVWQTRYQTFTSADAATRGPLSVDVALIRPNSGMGTYANPDTYVAGTFTNLTQLTSFPGPNRTPNGTLCFSGATSWGYCGFTVEAGIKPTVIHNEAGTQFARVQVWQADPPANDTNIRVCGGDSGGTVYGHFPSGGESIYGVVTARGGATRPAINGSACSANLLFTYWGQAASVLSGLTPHIVSN